MNNTPLQFNCEYEQPDLIKKATQYLTLLLIFLLPWGDGLWDGTPRVVATLCFGIVIIQFLTSGTHRNYTYYHFFIILYIAWLLLSMLWTPDLEWAKGVASTAVQLILLCFLFSLVIDNKALIIKSYQAYVFGNITGALIIINNFIHGIETNYYGRYGINNIETDTLSIILAVSLPMAAYLAFKQTNKVIRLINLLAIPLIFYAIFLTGTRTGSIVGLIGILYWVFTHRSASFLVKSSIAFVMVVSVIAIFTLAPKASIDRIFSAGQSISSGTLNSRTSIWRGSLKEWEKSPIIGSGLGGLGFVLSKEHVNYRGAHNVFIQLLTEDGIIGLSLYLLIIISLLYYLLHTPIDEKAFLFTLLMVLLVSQLTTHTHLDKFVWFAFTMIAIHSQKYSYVESKSS